MNTVINLSCNGGPVQDTERVNVLIYCRRILKVAVPESNCPSKVAVP